MWIIEFENGKVEIVSGMTYNMACWWAETFGDKSAFSVNAYDNY